MKQKKTLTITSAFEAGNPDTITEFRYGTLHGIDEAIGAIWVDYPDNPTNRPLRAGLACPFITLDDLKRARVSVCMVQLNFIENDPSRPLVRDIYFSFVDQVKQQPDETIEKTVHLQAERLILEGTQEVVIKSGKVTTVYKGESGQLIEEADSIRSTAKTRNRLQGGAVLIN